MLQLLVSVITQSGLCTRRIKTHLSSCKSRVPAGDSDQQVVDSLVIDDPHVDPEFEAMSSMIHGEAANIDLFSTNLADYLTLDSGGDYRIPASCKTIIDGHAYPNFGDERNDAFFGQEQQLFNKNGQHRGWGGVAWDSMAHFKQPQASL